MNDEAKKNYYGVYGTVLVLYIIMIIVYAVVVSNATKNGAADNVPCKYDEKLNDCGRDPPTTTDAISLFLQSVINVF